MTVPAGNGRFQGRSVDLMQEEAIERIERDAWLDLFAAAPSLAIEALSLSHKRVNGIGLLASSVVPITELNRAVAFGVDTTSSEREIDLAVEWLDENAADGWALQIRPDAMDVRSKAALERAELEPAGNGWAKFVRPTTNPDGGSRISACKVIRADAGMAETYGRTSQGGFGLPETFAVWFSHLAGRPGWSCFLAIIEGVPVGAAAMFVRESEAWLGIDTVLQPYRTRGVHADLIAARVSQAVKQQVRTLTCETAKPQDDDADGYSSYRNYKKAGFELVYTRPNFKRRAALLRSPA